MRSKSKSIKGILSIALMATIIMYMVEGFIKMDYSQKSTVKILLFMVLPIIYTLYDKNITVKDHFKIRAKKILIYSSLLGLSIYLMILAAYFVLKDFIDLSSIIEILDKNVGVSKNNFLRTAFYISLVNSLLEEFFFRGFMFANLSRISGRKFAYGISAFVFSVYHVAIMGSWFSPIIFALAMLGLFVGALIFNYLTEKGGNIYNSWLVHVMANLSINTVGLIMFGII